MPGGAEPDLFDLMARLKAAQTPFVLATVVRTVAATAAKAGAKAVITADGELRGWIGGGCTQGGVKRAAIAALGDGKARLISIQPRETLESDGALEGLEYHGSVCPSGGTVDVFIEPMLPAPTLVLWGSSPVAEALADLAPRIGFAVRQGDQPGELEGEGFIVVATQGRRDFEALAAAVATRVRYVAFVGSRRKMAALRARLIESGIAPDRAESVKAPAGLDIGSITPEEIALSILAEIVKERRGGSRGEAQP